MLGCGDEVVDIALRIQYTLILFAGLQTSPVHTQGGGIMQRRFHSRARTPVTVAAGDAAGVQQQQQLGARGEEQGHAKWQGGVSGALRLGAGNAAKAGLTFDKLDD